MWFSFTHRYEKELMHPIQNLLSGELARALLIQVLSVVSNAYLLLFILYLMLYLFSAIAGAEAKVGYWDVSSKLISVVDNQNFVRSISHVIVTQVHLMARAMLELDQILRANEINFAILAALPAFFISLLLLMLVRAWLKQV